MCVHHTQNMYINLHIHVFMPVYLCVHMHRIHVHLHTHIFTHEYAYLCFPEEESSENSCVLAPGAGSLSENLPLPSPTCPSLSYLRSPCKPNHS